MTEQAVAAPSAAWPLDRTAPRARGAARRVLLGAGQHAFLLVFSVFAILPAVFSVFASFKNLFDFYNDPLGLADRLALGKLRPGVERSARSRRRR